MFYFRCDLTIADTIPDHNHVGYIDVTSAGPINFLAQRHSSFSATSSTGALTVLTYDFITVNNGNGMNPHTGIFTVPKPGRYHFTFTAITKSMGTVATMVLNKQNCVAAAYSMGSGSTNAGGFRSKFTLSLSVVLSLKAKDTVEMALKGSSVYFDQGGVEDGIIIETASNGGKDFGPANFRYTNFAGMLIDEDLSISL